MIAGVGLLAVGGRRWLGERAEALAVKPGEAPPAAVRVVAVEPEVVAASLSYSAAVEELEQAELSFRVGGTVEALHQVEGPGGRSHGVHEGDRIPRGATLAKLDPSDYRRDRDLAAERLAIAEARLAQSESDAALAQIESRRAEQLLKRSAGSASDLDAARARQLSTAAAVAGARRDVESARISLAQAEANLSYCTLTMPFEEGTVAARHVDAGERVAANQRAFLVLDLSSVVIAFGVPDTQVGRLELGREVEVTCDALPGTRFVGVIHKIGSAADPQTRTYAVEVRVDEPGGLRPGMVATAHFRRESRAYLLPLTSIVPRSASGAYDVYRVADEGGRTVARRVPVAFDDVLDNRVAVRLDEGAPLRPGDRVVATGTHRLHDGQPVQVEE